MRTWNVFAELCHNSKHRIEKNEKFPRKQDTFKQKKNLEVGCPI
jgi:hypothetical protein